MRSDRPPGSVAACQIFWFAAGLALGIVLMDFVMIGSFDRGADSVRRHAWKVELVARKRAAIASRSRHPFITRFVPDLLTAPAAATVQEREITGPVPAAERRTRIRRDHRDVLTHISV